MLLEKLATGGMAEVFLARGTGAGGIGKFFAIKRILPQYADSPEFIDMFKDEAKIAINLNHSNIVSIHEFGVEKGQFFLVMDYVEGRNLRQILNKMKKSSLQFSVDQITFVIKEVAAGLDHAHRCIDGSTGKPLNITHRDMSPQNLMVSFEGEVKVVDFGIAKAESQIETTRAGTLKGKFGYMSPEQADGQPVDLRTDIFSLGIVLWELLANDRLFVANNELNTLRKIRDCQIPSLRKINPNIHTELERIVQKALARDRNLRYQTGAALHRDLNRFLNRQYPDFSPQDFSVFIKSVFADEILALRKRLVDYAKVNLSAGAKSSSADRSSQDTTSMFDTNTNSLVVSQGTGKPSSNVKTEKSPDTTEKSNSSAPDIDLSSTSMPSMPTTPSVPSVPAASMPSMLSVPSIPSTPTIRQNTNNENLPPLTLQPSVSAVLDETALALEMKREPNLKMDTEHTSSPSINRKSTDTRSVYGGARGIGRAPGLVKARSRGKPVQFATFMVFTLLCFSIYAYLVKYFTPMMADVITMTDPVLHDFHTTLGVDPHITNSASNGAGEHLPDIPPASATSPPAANVKSTHLDPQAQKLEDDINSVASGLIVVSNPSGAAILVNDKDTGLVTPARVTVPADRPFKITVHKYGYMDFKGVDVKKTELGHRLTANLVKLNVAYLDIDVFPPQDAVISINGKVISARVPIRELAVSANTPLRIRAERKGGGSFDEMVINLPVDRKQAIQLNPRKNIRVPSNLPNQ